MRVPADHPVKSSQSQVRLHLTNVVYELQFYTVDENCRDVRNSARPFITIDIALDRDNGSQGLEYSENVGPADIPGVKNGVHAAQFIQDLRAYQSMGV